MRKIFFVALGSAAMLVSVGQAANAKNEQRARRVEQRQTIFTDAKARNANALYQVAPQVDTSRYTGGFSAPAGH